MNAPIQSTEPNAHATTPESPLWRLQIDAEPEPLLLSRILQKLAVPEIELRTAHYEAGTQGRGARAELTFCAVSSRARLVAVRLRKIVGMERVTLQAADCSSASVSTHPGAERHPSS